MSTSSSFSPFSRMVVAVLVLVSWSVGYGQAQTVTKAPGATMTTQPKSATAAAKRSPPAPDPGLFDGSGYPPEERPERGLLADFEAGAHEPSAGGPEEEEGPGGGGQQEEQAQQIAAMTPSLTQSGAQQNGSGGDQEAGSNGQNGGSEGQAGQEGQSATPIAAAADQQPVKPGEVALGDPNSRIAQAPEGRQPRPGAQTTNERGEDRMSVKSAAGAQSTPNRSRGGERGIDIPSNL